MCGIFGYIGKKNDAAKIVLEGLKKLEYRGYDSWGIATLNSKFNGKLIVIKKRVGKIGEAKVSDLPKNNFALGHTRWATHGGVTEVNAHPHLDCSGRFAIIHNGIIENYDEIKKELKKKGHRFISETDTEVAVHLIEETFKKRNDKKLTNKNQIEKVLEAVRRAFNRFVGLNAIIVMDAVTQIFVAAKNGSPLVIGKGRDENFLASDAHALAPFTRNVYFMEDDELVMVASDKIFVMKTNGIVKKINFSQINLQASISEKGKFSHYMLKEIFDQKKVIESIASDNKDNIENFAKLIKKSYGTYLVGCGTAAYACMSGSYIFSKIAKRHINFSFASEFGWTVDFLTDKSFVIGLSQSGETIDLIEALKKAKMKKSKIGALVNVAGSTLFRMADHKLLLSAGVEKAVVSTKAFTAKLALLTMLAFSLIGDLEKGQRELYQVVRTIKGLLNEGYLNKIRKLVDYLYDKDHIYSIGRGLSYPIALETALKIKESSYIHAEGFAAGELKHGVIALIEKGTPCLAFVPDDDTYGATLAGAMEMKARGGYIVGISDRPHEIFDYYLPVSKCGVVWNIAAVVIGQLLGYFLAVKRGLDPDKPRNLAKSVTVK